jgi:signal transduction histidine kinase
VESSDERRRLAAPSWFALDDLLAELLTRTREVVDARDGLWKLIEAVVSVASAELSLAAVLNRVVEVAKDMLDVEYAALGVIAEGGALREFVHTGMDPNTVDRIGHLPEGHGILGLLIREPQVLRLDDLSEHPASVGFPEHHPRMGSFLGVPIEVRDKIYGNLYLANRRGGEFTNDDVGLVTTLAAAAGVAIDHARVREESQRRQRWLKATGDVVGELLGGGDTTQVLDLLTTRVRQLCNAAVSTLMLAGDGDVVIASADGLLADELRGRRFRALGSVTREVLASGEAVALEDLTRDRNTGPLVNLGRFGPAMFLPLGARGRRLGTLAVARERGQEVFDDDDLQFAVAFAAQAALALDYGDAQTDRRRAAVFEERERIGDDLHDLVIQRLFATGLSLESVTARVTDPVAGKRVHDAIDEIDAAIRDLRSSIFGLHARRGETASLDLQIEEICTIAQAALGFAPEVEVDPAADAVVSDDLAPDLLAVVRESLTNVSRHADASHVSIRLHVADDTLCLEVVDNGRGIAATGRRSGIANMRARAERFHGSMDIGRADGGGTHVRWCVPVR